jgi:hypothetical protein
LNGTYNQPEMPKLLVFAPCEKVIISRDENNPTLIAILHTIGGEVRSHEPVAPGTMAPMRWSVFTLWQRLDGEDGKILEQRLRLRSPSGKTTNASTPQELNLSVETIRSTVTIGQVPVSEVGTWEIQLFLNEKGQQIPEQPLATYPLQIRFKIVPPADKESTS